MLIRTESMANPAGTGEPIRLEPQVTAPATQKRIPELDGLRGIAICLVIAGHYVTVPGDSRVALFLQRCFSLSWTGVDLFFVLSGFLIGGILLDARESPGYFRTFYTRRFFRIFPIYYIWVGLYVLMVHFARPYLRAHTASGIVPPLDFGIYAHFLYLQNFAIVSYIAISDYWFAQTWSLAVEEQFYLVSPLTVRLLNRKTLFWTLTFIVALTPFVRLFVRSYFNQGAWMAYRLMPARADSLSLGILVAIGWRSHEFRAWVQEHTKLLYGVPGLLAAGIIVLWKWFPNPQSVMDETIGFTWIASFYALVMLIALSRPDSLIARVGRIGWLRECGRVSYCMYIIHAAMNLGLHVVLLKGAPQINNLLGGFVTVAAALATYVTACVSWKLLEGPLIRIGHEHKYHPAVGK